MSYCLDPLLLTLPGSFASADPMSGKVLVRCRKCPACVAARKNDLAGKLMAEAQSAASVYFLTLTYADEPEDFCYRDVQLMMKQLRKAFAVGRRPAQVRFFCVGERGNLRGRIHWHLLLFFDRKVSIAPPKKGRLWRFWEFGWAQVASVPNGDRVKRVRYCAKYAVKMIGQESKATRPRGSVALGRSFMIEEAERTARAGLPFHGQYTVPDLIFTKGPKAGFSQRFRMLGASARVAAVVYVDTWERERGDNWPDTLFTDRYYQAKPRRVEDQPLSKSYVVPARPLSDTEFMDDPDYEPPSFTEEEWAGFRRNAAAKRERELASFRENCEQAVASVVEYERTHAGSEGACAVARAAIKAYWAARIREICVPAWVPEVAYVAEEPAPIPDAVDLSSGFSPGIAEKHRREAAKDIQRAAYRAFLRADNLARAAYRAERFLKVNGKLPKGVTRPGQEKQTR